MCLFISTSPLLSPAFFPPAHATSTEHFKPQVTHPTHTLTATIQAYRIQPKPLRPERSTTTTKVPKYKMSSIISILSFSVLAFFASTAQAHMVMATPPPYGSPDNSPLNADGSNFPCKATSDSGGTVTNMAVGASQKLSFLGESVHGGGSCQVSLTTDTPATKSSTWMVIHSIEGGCPARNQAGNIGADDSASAPDPDTYNFSIPPGITPGAYTLAWTWFNKVGNREMYMNCASIKVAGVSSKRETTLNETQEYAIPELFGRATASFPAMFVANIPSTDCTTAEGTDVKFPNPGLSVEMASANKADVLTPPTGPK